MTSSFTQTGLQRHTPPPPVAVTLGGGIVVTPGQVHRSFAIPTGRWCSSFQADMKAMVKALEVIQEGEPIQKTRVVSDSLSVLTSIQSIHPSDTSINNDEKKILQLLYDT